MPASSPPSAPFPSAGLLPKENTQAASFVRKFPTYDGRDVVVAILDTGVDVAAKGLNRPGKFVDVLDCTGSGDIHLTPVEPIKGEGATPKPNTIAIESPATGRKLILDSSWSNPTGVWKHGYRRAYELWPNDLIARRKAERAKAWNVEHAKLLSRAHEDLFQAENAKAGEGAAAKAEKELKVDEMKARISVLKELSFDDCGPIVEVVAWHDGKTWRTVVGGAEGELVDPTQGWPKEHLKLLKDSSVDLTTLKPLADFRVEGKHDRFGDADMLTYTASFLLAEGAPGEAKDGAAVRDAPVLSLVVNSGSHATHVAGIVAAEREDDEGQQGVAHGARLVTMKIGDTRMGSMETQQALLRAATALVALKVDVANLSFGESAAFGCEDKGLFVQQLRDVVIRERDILFISSAGNNGPALSTVGAPGGTTSGVLSVQAYLHSGSMLEAEYANIEEGNVASNPTTWCSRGPTYDGARGGIYAPGAAITSIPVYCQQATMLANGTSMSSPNACGGISLLLSAMKQEGIPITPERVFKAVRATGKDLHDDLAIPLLQVEDAWNYIVKNKDRADADFEYRVAVAPAGKPVASVKNRGIYLRSVAETSRVNAFTATIQPTFHANEKQKRYELQIKAAISPSESWVTAPGFVFLGGNGRSFEIRVDPTRLPTGLSIASVDVYDTDQPGLLLATIPVTVCKPEPVAPTVRFDRVRLDKGRVERKFVGVPAGATWAEVRFRSSRHENPGTSAKFWYHFATPVASVRLPDAESAALVALNEEEPIAKKISVKGGETMEVALACFHGSAAVFDLSCEIEFHGISVTPVLGGRDDITIVGGDGLAKFEAVSQVRVEELKPVITFDTIRNTLRPTSSEIRPLPFERDVLPSGERTQQLLLTYAVSQNQDGPAKTTISTPLAHHLYDSAVPMLSSLWDVNKRLVTYGDVYPKTTDLPKGSYTLRVQVLSPSVANLEKLRNMTVNVDTKMSKAKEASLYEDQVDAFGDAKPATFKGYKLLAGEKKVFYMDTALGELPKEASPGDVLLGTISLSGGVEAAKSKIRYIVPPKPSTKKDSKEGGESGGDKDDKEDDEALAELLAGLAKQVPESRKEAYLKKLVSEHPKSLAVLTARLEALKADEAKQAKDVIAASDAIISSIDEPEILLWQGTKRAPASEQSPEEKKQAKHVEKRKTELILAHNRKVRALLAVKDETNSASDAEAFNKAFEAYRRLADASSAEYVNLHTRWAVGAGRHGTALQAVRKTIKDLGNGTSSTADELRKAKELQRDLVERLGWTLISVKLDRERVTDANKDFVPF